MDKYQLFLESRLHIHSIIKSFDIIYIFFFYNSVNAYHIEYDVCENIGMGTFSKVYAVQEIKTGIYFAAKKLLKTFRNDEEVNDYHELKASMRLEHPNIVKFIESI